MKKIFHIDKIVSEISQLEYKFAVDAHCHIESDGYTDAERKYAIERSLEKKIVLVTSPLTMPERYYALELSKRYLGWIYVTTASHPLYNEPIDDVIEFIRKHSEEIIGIGEVGLDFHPPNNTEDIRSAQIKKFEVFISLAKELDKPLVVHSRSAGKYALDVLIRNSAEKVLMHSFSGNVKYAKKGIEAGYYFSIPPTVAYSPQKQKLVKALPLENMMLESDAPALSPESGKVNWPWNILFAATIIATIKEIDVRDVINETAKNAMKLFRITPLSCR